MDTLDMHGHVDTFIVAPDGTRTLVDSGKNTLSYLCADAVARLFAGDLTARPTTIGFVMGSTNSLATFGFTDGDRDKTQADIVGTGLSVSDVSVAPNPTRTASTTNYGGNVVTFSAMTTDTAKAYCYGFILKDASGNVLAAKKLSSPVSKASGYAISASWAVTFV